MSRPRVLIIGGGFGGVSAARELAGTEVDVTILDRTNHHVFQPLLYQVATATLSPADISVPIRWLMRKARNVETLLGAAGAIDVARRTVRVDELGRELAYDFLILAPGARHSYFGHPEWEGAAPGLKSLDDAQRIRQRLLLALEDAERTTDPAVRRACLTMVVVGGGPTGVELAGIIPEVLTHGLAREFRHADTTTVRVLLVEAGPRLLSAFPEDLAARAQRDLAGLGVEVRTGTTVTRIEDGSVWLGDERIDARTILWAAGNAASPLLRALGAPLDRAGRVRVSPDLSVPGHPEVFVVGDAAAVSWGDGLVPGVAPAANQGGTHAARQVLRTVRHQERRPFRYRDKGNLATIGRYRAIADFGHGIRLTGPLAWWFWLFVHILYLAGFRNRATVLVQWAYAYFTYERGVRLILGRGGEPPATRERHVEPQW